MNKSFLLIHISSLFSSNFIIGIPDSSKTSQVSVEGFTWKEIIALFIKFLCRFLFISTCFTSNP